MRKILNWCKVRLFDVDRKKKSYKDDLNSYRKALYNLASIANIDSTTPSNHSRPFPLLAEEENDESLKLKALFAQHGSDKSTVHNYYLLYAKILKERSSSLTIFEMGLGTNNLDMISNMGPDGRPGASLRAFKEMYPNAGVYGADIDRQILFQEDGIQTLYADQLAPESLERLAKDLDPLQFDLIIDDGLHTPEANTNTLHFALKLLKPDGYFVIEDIQERDLGFFTVMQKVLELNLDIQMLETKAAHVCIVRKKQRS